MAPPAVRSMSDRLRLLFAPTPGRLEFAARLAAHLSALNPKLVLERGYAIVARDDGAIVRDAAQLASGDAVQITLARGAADARITDTHD